MSKTISLTDGEVRFLKSVLTTAKTNLTKMKSNDLVLFTVQNILDKL